jgi:hypothetical protein
MSLCTKIPYSNPRVAAMAMVAIADKTADTRPKVPRSVYHCARCHSWHLSSQKPKGVASRRWTMAFRT